MRNIFLHYSSGPLRSLLLVAVIAALAGTDLRAQDSTTAAAAPVKKKSYTKNTFEANFLIDEQTVMVPVKGSFEFYINHRFGTVNNGIKDLYGIFAGANMRLGFSYVPVKDLQVGFGVNNYNMEVDGNLKYAILKQTKDNSMPISVTYFGVMVMNTSQANSSNMIVATSDRFSFFNQILVARKINEKLSVQAGIALTHFNNVAAYYDANHEVQPLMEHDNLTFCAGGRYKLTPGMAIIVNYDQPLTQNLTNNPHPNFSFGLEMSTSGHDFQIFAGNYGYTLPTDNTVYNQNDISKGQFVIGFNISRLWNF